MSDNTSKFLRSRSLRQAAQNAAQRLRRGQRFRTKDVKVDEWTRQLAEKFTRTDFGEYE